MPDLPAGYHLRNFECLLDVVAAEYADLLVPEESGLVALFRDLSAQARSLYVRLASRRGPLFRADRLDYADVPDVDAALLELTLAGFVTHAGRAGPEALLDLYTRAEIERALRSRGDSAGSGLSKPRLLGLLVESGRTPGLLGLAAGPIVCCRHLDVLRVFRLLFFGNLRQDLTEFVVSELGVMRYETYRLTGRAYFRNRGVVDDLLHVHAWSRSVRAAQTRGDPVELAELGARVASWKCEPEAERRRDQLVLGIARDLERLDAREQALRLYSMTDRSPSRERRARVLHSLGRRTAVVDVCTSILDDPSDEAEAVFAARFCARVLRPEGTPDLFEAALLRRARPLARRHRRPFDCRRLELTRTGARVEEAVVSSFETQGVEAHYVENGLFPSLFGLAFWDVVFAELPGAFFNPFQRGPSDLYSADFRERRRDLIRSRLDELAAGTAWKDRVRYHYASRTGTVSPFVTWRTLTPRLLERALERIPGGHLRDVSERILTDPRGNRTGFPDLVVFTHDGGYRLVEVKGPGDALQDNQKRWLHAFADFGIPASVVDVAWRN